MNRIDNPSRRGRGALWLGSLVAGAAVFALPASALAASPELTDACTRFVASSPMSALPDDCQGVVSPLTFPVTAPTLTPTTSSNNTTTAVPDSEAPQVVANADAAFLASAAGQELLGYRRPYPYFYDRDCPEDFAALGLPGPRLVPDRGSHYGAHWKLSHAPRKPAPTPFMQAQPQPFGAVAGWQFTAGLRRVIFALLSCTPAVCSLRGCT